MTLQEFNHSDKAQMSGLLKSTCGSEAWTNQMMTNAPFDSKEALLKSAEEHWFNTKESDWLEAFLHHPEIGNIDSLREKYSQGRVQSEEEQQGVNEAQESVLIDLSNQNKAYREKFGFIFIVFATGKSAEQMLGLLNSRINNTKDEEIHNAMQEQWKITKLRLNNLID